MSYGIEFLKPFYFEISVSGSHTHTENEKYKDTFKHNKNNVAVLKWDMICSRYERGRLGFNLYMYTETFHPLSISTEQSVADKLC